MLDTVPFCLSCSLSSVAGRKSYMEHVLKVKLLTENSRTPTYAHEGDAGLDLFSSAEKLIQPGESALIPTGICIQLPAGMEAQVRPRSGLALKHQITVLNSPGTIDEGYRGEIGVILINHGHKIFKVDVGMKIAQMVIQPVIRVRVEESEELDIATRGDKGFGSTGV
jgi:dUTP pyrophosphatase